MKKLGKGQFTEEQLKYLKRLDKISSISLEPYGHIGRSHMFSRELLMMIIMY